MGGPGGTRTPKGVSPADFESTVSAIPPQAQAKRDAETSTIAAGIVHYLSIHLNTSGTKADKGSFD